jgi:hypothetical protein
MKLTVKLIYFFSYYEYDVINLDVKILQEKLIQEAKKIVNLEFKLEKDDPAKRFLSCAEDLIMEVVFILEERLKEI